MGGAQQCLNKIIEFYFETPREPNEFSLDAGEILVYRIREKFVQSNAMIDSEVFIHDSGIIDFKNAVGPRTT